MAQHSPASVPNGYVGTIDEYSTLLKSQIKHMRPWSEEFFNKDSIHPVYQLGPLRTRVEGNIKYFIVNYCCVCCVISLIALLFNPTCVLLLLLTGVIIVYVRGCTGECVSVWGANVPKSSAVVAVCVCASLGLFIVAGFIIFAIIGISTAVVVIHASLHKGVKASQGDEPDDDYTDEIC
eukprot:GHVR01068672.1.p1 GENE.GHVR01068672.1~~GHVR01068672.1.p1  ORF type:complete len:179 (+),score=42.33 GHVR01068672.1:40-576(+)